MSKYLQPEYGTLNIGRFGMLFGSMVAGDNESRLHLHVAVSHVVNPVRWWFCGMLSLARLHIIHLSAGFKHYLILMYSYEETYKKKSRPLGRWRASDAFVAPNFGRFYRSDGWGVPGLINLDAEMSIYKGLGFLFFYWQIKVEAGAGYLSAHKGSYTNRFRPFFIRCGLSRCCPKIMFGASWLKFEQKGFFENFF